MDTSDDFARFAATHLSTPTELPVPSPDISFGPRDTQVLSPEVASDLLTLWCQRAPGTFGAYLAEVLTGQKPRGGRQ